MKYLPAAAAAIGICGAVTAALFITQDANALWALFFLLFVDQLLPEEK